MRKIGFPLETAFPLVPLGQNSFQVDLSHVRKVSNSRGNQGGDDFKGGQKVSAKLFSSNELRRKCRPICQPSVFQRLTTYL